jgi:hypothetical protein
MSDVRQAAILATAAEIAASNAPAEPVTPDPVQATPDPVIAADAAPPAEVVSDDDDNDFEEAATSDAGADPTARPRKKPGVHQRIAELTREKHEERRARERIEQELAQLRQQAQPPAATQATPGRPMPEQFNDWNDYEAARDTWLLTQAKQQWAAEQKQAETLKQQQERQRKFQERIAAFEREVPGAWQEAVSAPITTTPAMLEVIAESEVGPRIAHYLATHLDEAYAISQQGPYAQAAALGRIEAELKRPPAAPPIPRNTVTRAPAPAPVVSSPTASGSTALKGVEDHIAAVRAQRNASR